MMKQTIGYKIKILRIRFGLSQQELAEKLYFSNRTISNWEKDLRVVSINNLEKVANFFQVPITYFTNDDENPLNFKTNETNPMKQIRVRKVEFNDYFFYVLLGLKLLNIILIFYPLGDRITFAAINFLIWFFILIYIITNFTIKQREQTTFFMVSADHQAYFSSTFSQLERKKFFYIRLSVLLFFLFFSMFFYASIFSMINNVQSDPILSITVPLLLFLLTIGHLYLIVQTFTQDLPQENMPYRHHDTFGLTSMRILMTMHYIGLIFFIILMTAFGNQVFPEDLLILNIMSGFLLGLALRIFYVYAIRFYSKFTLKTKDLRNQKVR